MLRCEGLDRRPLWYDEAATLLHLSGRTEAELRAWYDGRPLRPYDLVTSAGAIPPGDAATAGAVILAVAADEPQSGSGYFLLAHVWTRLAGDELAAVRALSAAASVLALGLAAWLAFRLCGSGDVALATAALVALSPLHLRYAQEARPYALWSLVLPLWALATLRARAATTRKGQASLANWIGYATACSAALWVHPLSLGVLPAVAMLAAAPASGRRDRRFWLATGLALLGWAVWPLLGWSARAVVARTTAWSQAPIGGVELARSWLGVVASVFYRPGGEGGLLGNAPWPLSVALVWLTLGLGAAGLAGVAVLMVARSPGGAARRFVLLLTVVPWAMLALPDVAFGGRRSTVARYLVPSWIGLELAVARTFTAPRWRRPLLLVVLGLGAATALRTRAAGFWWDTDAPRLRALAAAAVQVNAIAGANAVAGTVVVTDLPPLALLELARQLSATVTLRLGPAAPATIAAAEWERVVLVAPSASLLASARRAAGTRALVTVAEGAALGRGDSAPGAVGSQNGCCSSRAGSASASPARRPP